MLQFDALHLAIFGAKNRPMMVPLVALHPRWLRKNFANPVILLVKLVGRPRPWPMGSQVSRSRLHSLNWPISWVECIGPRLRVRGFTHHHTRVNDVFMTRFWRGNQFGGNPHFAKMGCYIDDYAAIFSQQCGPTSPSKRLYYSIGTSHMAASGNPWF